MKLISHRGNLDGPGSEATENNPELISEVLKTYDVEIDLWSINGALFLGHDRPVFQISRSFLEHSRLWIHAKNLSVVDYLTTTRTNWFWHESDELTITSRGFPWCLTNVWVNGGIMVVTKEDYYIPPDSGLYGICTDFITHYSRISQ